MGWGAYPVFLRYLQTVSLIPGFSLLLVANVLLFCIVAGAVWRQFEWQALRQPILWAFLALAVARAVTNMLATRFTLAIFAQLIYLMTPFIVAFLSRTLLKEALPTFTFRALVLCLLGALLMMRGDLLTAGENTAVFRNDPLGLSLAILSSLCLAGYMVLTRRSAKSNISSQTLLLANYVGISAFTAVSTFTVREDWHIWTQLSVGDWGVFTAVALGVLLLSNWGQLRSIQLLGASLVSSLMSTRLISSLLFASLLLGENLNSAEQFLGAGIVIITISWYLSQQAKGSVP